MKNFLLKYEKKKNIMSVFLNHFWRKFSHFSYRNDENKENKDPSMQSSKKNGK